MPDVTLNSNNYASYDFSQTQLVSQEKFESLLEAEGRMSDRVRFTLDEKHQLTAFKLPKNKDNAFVAFFKRIFSASYRRQEKLLENYEKLSQNATFNQKVTQEILYKLSNLGERANFISQRIKASIGRNPDFEITPKIICDEKFNSGMAITTVKHASLKKIVYQGELLSAKEFIAKFQGLECAGDGKITQAFLNKVIEGDKESIGAYLSQDAQDEIELLLAQDTLEQPDAYKLGSLISSATLAFLQDVGAYINGDLAKGENPGQVALYAQDIIDKVCDEDEDFSEYMDDTTGRIDLLSDIDDTKAVFDKDSLEPSRKANFESLKAAIPNYSDVQTFKLLNLIESKNLSVDKFLEFHGRLQNFKQDLVALSQAKNETEELQAFNAFNKSFNQALIDPKKPGQMLGGDDVGKICIFAAFELGLENTITPKGLNALENITHILAGFNEAGEDPYGQALPRDNLNAAQQRSLVNSLVGSVSLLSPYVRGSFSTATPIVKLSDLTPEQKIKGAKLDILFQLDKIEEVFLNNKGPLDPKVKADFAKLCESDVLEKISEFTSLQDYGRFNVEGYLGERMDVAFAQVQQANASDPEVADPSAEDSQA